MAMGGEHGHEGHAHDAPSAEVRLPRIAWGMIAVTALVVLAAWAITVRTADDYMALMDAQLRGAAPTQVAQYVVLSGVMMVAMMLPSALPMVAVYRGLAARDSATMTEARMRTTLFTLGYFVVWTTFTALALVALMAFGLMGQLGGAAAFVPGLLLVAAGAYQMTGWKQFCLNHCRTPMSFVMSHWKSGRAGALRMGLEHAAYCLGCCWLLMLVLFVAGAMSVLWMGVFAGLVLAEKVWTRGPLVSRALGIASLGVGLGVLGATYA
ncbi:MAG TPA: DUF2182 domain-containing protein, partial [Candidatus Thermoplasmatota archaeon]|nr:DUF2182 domain-containing protein [Candidatus Thermoplasmatota archaeon]